MVQVTDVKELVATSHSSGHPLSFLLQLLSLSTNAHKENNFNSRLTLVRMVVTGTIFCILQVFSLYYKFTHVYSGLSASVSLTDVVQSIYDYCQYTVDLLFVYKYGRHVYQEYYNQYTSIDQILGAGSCGAIRKKIKKLVFLFILIWLISTVMDFAVWVERYGWIAPVVYSLAYYYVLLKMLTNLDLTYQTMHIEVRLRVISESLQSDFASGDSVPGMKCSDPVQNENWLYPKRSTSPKNQESLKWSFDRRRRETRCLSRCYLLLREQTAFINQMFGVRVLLNSLSLLIDMVRFANLTVRIFTEMQAIKHQWEYFAAVSTMFRLLTCVAILTSLVHHCEMVYRQTDRIISIADHLLINKNPDLEMREVVTKLRELVRSRPINFHMAYFIRLDYSMLMSIASVVVTYTIILLQSLN